MWTKPQESADLVTFTEVIFNGKLRFCAVTYSNYDSEISHTSHTS